MKFLSRILFYLLVFSNFAFSQFSPGAREIALGNSAYALANDAFSVFYNPAGLAQINWKEFSVYYSPSPFGLKELANGNFALNYNLAFGNISLGAKIYGFELYRETSVLLGFSKRFFKRFFAGFTIEYNYLKIKNYGSANAFAVNLGLLYYLTRNLKFGFYGKNIFLASYSGEENEIPTELFLGLSFSPIESGNVNFAVTKQLGYTPSLKFGAEYELLRYVLLRVGFESEQRAVTAGLGIVYGLVEIDYAAFIHNVLPVTHQISITFATESIEKRNSKILKFLFGNEK